MKPFSVTKENQEQSPPRKKEAKTLAFHLPSPKRKTPVVSPSLVTGATVGQHNQQITTTTPVSLFPTNLHYLLNFSVQNQHLNVKDYNCPINHTR